MLLLAFQGMKMLAKSLLHFKEDNLKSKRKKQLVL
jgi:hypothetical protein